MNLTNNFNTIYYGIFINTIFAWFIFRALKCDVIIFPVIFSILSVVALIFMIIAVIRISFLPKQATNMEISEVKK